MGVNSDRCFRSEYLALVKQKARRCHLLELSFDASGDTLRVELGFCHGSAPIYKIHIRIYPMVEARAAFLSLLSVLDPESVHIV